ncbi:MAG: non-ribosomal peptide synthetase [Tumebacillaceae bacterium]
MTTNNEQQHVVLGQEDEVFVIPASFAQQRLWLVDQLEAQNTIYNILTAYRLHGPLHVPTLEQSLQAIVARHESLRTTFASQEGTPMQVVHPSLLLELPQTDLSGLAEAEREEQLQKVIAAENTAFTLGTGPLIRARLVRMSDSEHVLVVNMHHIISDGWSMSVFIRELGAFYEAFAAGREASLPEMPLQYADYSIWQRDWMQGEVLEEQLGYWKEQLGGTLPVMQLPTDRPRAAKQTYGGATNWFHLNKELSDGIKGLCQREGTTLYMTLLAAFQTLLHRYTGLEDVIVGSPMAGRNQEEIEGLIGFFVNTLVLRNDLSGNPAFRELLGRVREVTLGAFANQDVPFEKLVEELQPERNLSHPPLFQVIFAFENFENAAMSLGDVTLTPMQVDPGTAKFDLTLFMGEAGDELYARVEYNSDLFDAGTIARMQDNLVALLETVVADPEQRIDQVSILSESQRHQLLVEWNETETDFLQGKSSLHEMFEEQAAKTPDRIAVACEGKQLTYRELNERVNQLAHHLKKLGVGPEQMVGLSMERSLEMIIGLLAIVKAGGAYVPLDPAYPQERLTFMLEDAQVQVLVTLQHLAGELPTENTKVICLDSDWAQVAVESTENVACETNADNLLYVIYTSGSTGVPKGVCVTHRAVARLVRETNYVSFAEDEIFLQFAPISFDAATFEVWGSLLNGAKLAVYPPQKAALEDLGQAIRENGVTTMFLTCALFNQMVEAQPEALLSVRQLLVGGEQMSVTHAKQLLSKAGDWSFFNAYGPTETTTFATVARVTPANIQDASVPIGRPISNTTLYVLDRNLQPVPVGVPGELYIGGAGVARGYLNRPELSAEKFVAHPFSDEPGATLYRTGDIVRYLADGQIDILGRIDNQVKIRGFRIELGEIEVELGKHPSVREALVMAREDVPGDKRLVAYVLSEGETADAAVLRTFMKEKMPDYMVPSAFVALDSFPLTPNGKVDRKALPKPDYNTSGQAFVAPSTDVEKTIATIWTEVLGVEKVGVHDNFFDLGGHSLLATQTLSRLRKAFQVDVPLRILFESPTIAALSIWVEEKKADGKKAAPSMKAVSRAAFRKSASTLSND